MPLRRKRVTRRPLSRRPLKRRRVVRKRKVVRRKYSGRRRNVYRGKGDYDIYGRDVDVGGIKEYKRTPYGVLGGLPPKMDLSSMPVWRKKMSKPKRYPIMEWRKKKALAVRRKGPGKLKVPSLSSFKTNTEKKYQRGGGVARRIGYTAPNIGDVRKAQFAYNNRIRRDGGKYKPFNVESLDRKEGYNKERVSDNAWVRDLNKNQYTGQGDYWFTPGVKWLDEYAWHKSLDHPINKYHPGRFLGFSHRRPYAHEKGPLASMDRHKRALDEVAYNSRTGPYKGTGDYKHAHGYAALAKALHRHYNPTRWERFKNRIRRSTMSDGDLKASYVGRGDYKRKWPDRRNPIPSTGTFRGKGDFFDDAGNWLKEKAAKVAKGYFEDGGISNAVDKGLSQMRTNEVNANSKYGGDLSGNKMVDKAPFEKNEARGYINRGLGFELGRLGGTAFGAASGIPIVAKGGGWVGGYLGKELGAGISKYLGYGDYKCNHKPRPRNIYKGIFIFID